MILGYAKSLAVFRSRFKDAGLVMVSHAIRTIRDYCDAGIVFEGGKARHFPDVKEAITVHGANMEAAV